MEYLTKEDLEHLTTEVIDSAVDGREDFDEDARENVLNPRAESRLSNGSSVPTERADSRASVRTSPPGSPCHVRFTSRDEHLESTAEPDVPCRIRTRKGESSELRLRCMLSEREKYILDPCAWKLGAVQVMAHRHGMVKFINELRRDFGLNSRVTWKAVTYMDRYVCLTSSGESSGGMLERADLCAVVCLLLACKFQERFFPSIPKLLDGISSPYTKEELKAAEVRAPAACCPTTEPHLAPRVIPAYLATLLTHSRVRPDAAGRAECARVEPQHALAARRDGGDGHRPVRALR